MPSELSELPKFLQNTPKIDEVCSIVSHSTITQPGFLVMLRHGLWGMGGPSEHWKINLDALGWETKWQLESTVLHSFEKDAKTKGETSQTSQ